MRLQCVPCVLKLRQALHEEGPYVLDERKNLETGELDPLHSVKAGEFRPPFHL